jgi:hypothetical protein
MLNLIKYKKIWIISTIAFLALSVLIVYKINYVRDVNIEGDHIEFSNLQNLYNFSQLVVIGSPTKDFKDREQKSTFFPDGTLEDFYSVSNIKIEKILKAPNDFDKNTTSLDIVEPVALVENGLGKEKFMRDSYTELKKGSKYIIYLTKNIYNRYTVNGFDARFNLEGTDPEDEGKEGVKEHKKELKKEIEAKYQELFKK